MSPKPELRFTPLRRSSDCPICSSVNSIRHVSTYPSEKERFRLAVLFFCSDCGSGHVPDADALLEGYYESQYGAGSRFNRNRDPEEFFSDSANPRFRTYFSRARIHVSELKAVGAKFDHVLDFGGGQGVFLHTAKPKKPYAAELDPQCEKYLNYLGAQIIDPRELPAEKFDILVASHVVEHFTDTTLMPTLRNMVSSLKPGGTGLIEVPHGGLSYLHKARYQEPHTLFFTPAGLSSTISKLNVEILVRKAQGANDIPPRKNAIYRPPEGDGFASERREGLTIIFRRP